MKQSIYFTFIFAGPWLSGHNLEAYLLYLLHYTDEAARKVFIFFLLLESLLLLNYI